MSTTCYAMVRGSALRMTALDNRGRVADPAVFAVSKSVAKVTINEVIETGGNETLANPEEDRRLHFVKAPQTIRHKADIEFLRVDPEALALVSGVQLVYGPAGPIGFGETPFGEGPYGEGEPGSPSGNVVGFDSGTRLTTAAFALEVWSKLAGTRCEDGQQAWGYTLFPYLRGGHLSGFEFSNGLVSFNLIGAQTRRASRWGVGPYDLTGPYERLIEPVSRNTSWRTFVTSAAPPAETCGIQQGALDVLDNGTASNPMPDPTAYEVVDGGGAETSPFIIDGGRA